MNNLDINKKSFNSYKTGIPKLLQIERQIKIKQYKQMVSQRKKLRHNCIQKLFKNQINSGLKSAYINFKLSQNLKQKELEQDFVQYMRVQQSLNISQFNNEIQYLFDLLMVCRFLQKMKKKEEIPFLLITYKFPILQKKESTDMLQSNQYKSEVAKYQGLIKSLILVTRDQSLTELTQKFYRQYINIMETFYGKLEIASAYFQFALFYFNIKDINTEQNVQKNDKKIKNYMMEGKEYFLMCKQIRQKYGQSIGLADVNTNLALIEYYNHNIKQAISLIKCSLQMKIDIYQKYSIEMCYQLETLSKWLLMQGEFKQSIQYLKVCYKQKKKSNITDQKQLTKLEVLLIFFFRTITQTLIKEHDLIKKQQLTDILITLKKEILNKYQFSKYQITKNKFETPLRLNITFDVFQLLSVKSLYELNIIQSNIRQLPIIEGIKFIHQSKFYKKLNKEVKIRIDRIISDQLEQNLNQLKKLQREN